MRKFNLFFVLIASIFFTACNNDETEAINEVVLDATACEIATGFNAVETMVGDEKLYLTENNDYIFQGDILLSQEQIDDFTASDAATRGGILNQSKYKWTDGIIYYTIASGTTNNTRNMVYRAIDILERETMLKFIPRTNHKDYVEFFNGSGCWSYLGKVGGKQQISIDNSWAITGNVIHEILHAAGVIHEHSRSDRNNFINVNYNNIKSTAKSDYDISSLSHTILHVFIGPPSDDIDYGSIMIYGSWSSANAINPSVPVMTKKDGITKWDAQRDYPSYGDKGTVAIIYGFKPGGGGDIIY